MLLSTLGATLLGNLLTGNRVKKSNAPARRVMRAAEKVIAATRG